MNGGKTHSGLSLFSILLLMDAPKPVSIKAGGHEGFDYEVILNPVQVVPGTLYMPFRDKYDIRVVHLLPGLPHEQIRCILVYLSLRRLMGVGTGEIPYYEALSYVWGDPTVTESIFVDGQEVQVTTNLKAALRRLRWVTRARPLWIDALSINQNDSIEKGYQIGFMTEIYFRASAVICWLGEEADDSDVVLFLLDELSRTQDTPAYDAVDILKKVTCPRFAESFEKLLERPWWSRAWILQEISLGKNVLMFCGGRSIFWKRTKHALEVLDTHDMLDSSNISRGALQHIIFTAKFQTMQISHPNFGTIRSVVPLFRLLAENRSRGATDARDKVYAFTGLACDTPNCLKDPDYKERPNELYMRTTRAIIETTGVLDVLSYASSTEKNLDLPSWAPDWSIIPRLSPLKARTAQPFNARDYDKNLYRASGDTKSTPKPLSNALVLSLSGFIVDEITLVGSAMTEQDSNLVAVSAANCVRQWGAMAGAMKSPDQPYVGGGTIVDAIQHTIVAGMSAFPSHSPKPTKPTPYDEASFWQWLEPKFLAGVYSKTSGQELNRHNLEESIRPWIKHVVRTIMGRRMVLSRRGYVALVPAAAEICDRICVLYGGGAPFVLREKDKGSILIGECYVYGLMDGEMTGNDKEMQWFSLV
jgi:hypothetical protein